MNAPFEFSPQELDDLLQWYDEASRGVQSRAWDRLAARLRAKADILEEGASVEFCDVSEEAVHARHLKAMRKRALDDHNDRATDSVNRAGFEGLE